MPHPATRTTLVRGGTVVTAEAVLRADVLIRDGIVAAVGDGADWAADDTIDAGGALLLPGGVDAHTHLEYPIDGFTTRTADDFTSGTVAAAHGGTTTVIDFVKKEPDRTLYETFLRRREDARARCVVDFGLHAIVPPRDQQPEIRDDLLRLLDEGVSSWKFFMAYPGTQMVDDAQLLADMTLAAEHGALPMVHAENGHLVAHETRRLVDAGHVAEHHHHAAHPHAAEAEAVHRALVLAEAAGSPLFVVHVSSARAADELARARAAGRPAWGETCPQYLVAAYEDYAGLGERAAGWICSPPIRERANQDALWTHLAAGGLSTVGTDHAGFCLGQPPDLPPQKLRKPGWFPGTPNGVPGVEERLALLYHHGVAAGRLSPSRFVEITATRPAKLFGLHPRKGTIAAGADADLVVWDPDAHHVLSADTAHSRPDYSLYEGMEVTGRAVHVLSRGELVVSDGTLLGRPGRGRYLHRTTTARST
ncbi:dihydropyrimidinase [Streptomyces sp. MP131-18]|uniref:dihydropyrimidinase n=1 Tax=Streptomyces sp. MP131-18 TaxID=1857892 RepID=UPI00097C5472|nr:dihydropyrimidinase [Streptomyces sp. MP131-18]ONK10215.1 D-hydantoinase [Streptomyces sp. MP131-18]